MEGRRLLHSSRRGRGWTWPALALFVGGVVASGRAGAEAERLFPLATDEYLVRSGDTLVRIAGQHRTTVGELQALNPELGDPRGLQAGQPLRVPAVEVYTVEGAIGCELLLEAEEEGLALPLTSEDESQGRLIFAERVSEDFARAVGSVAERLGMEADHLMAIMHYETGGSFRASVRNPSTGAVGLIQFLPSTARRLGTSTEELAALSAVEQLLWVERYLQPFRGRLGTLEDAYMAVLYPVAVGEDPDFVLFREGSLSYQRNPYLDRDQDGVVTKGEVGEEILRILERGLRSLASA